MAWWSGPLLAHRWEWNHVHVLDNPEATVMLSGHAESLGWPHTEPLRPSLTSGWKSAVQWLTLPVRMAGPQGHRDLVEHDSGVSG